MKLKLILTIIPVFMIVTSCDKDFLEPDSISTFDTNYVFSNVDDARNGVNAVYSHFNQDAFRSRLSNNMAGSTDIEIGYHNAEYDNGRREIWNLDAQDTNGDLNAVWTVAYRAIRDANIAIEGINNSGSLNASNVSVKNTFNHLLGEAHTLRAYWYSMLAFHFGDVPYVTQAPVAGANFFLPKTNRNEILTKEIQALIDVEANMQWRDASPYSIEQVTREYTLGMIARLALQRGGYYLKPNGPSDYSMVRDSDYLDYYTIAKQYSRKLIDLKDRELPTDFGKIFLSQNLLVLPPGDDDILFEVPFANGGGDVGWNIGIRVDGGINAKHAYGSGSNYMAMPPSYYLSFDSKDKRRDVTCGLYRVTVDDEKVHVGINISQAKWNRRLLPIAPGRESAKGTGINWPMLRYSDVLLMYAEAENELNGPTLEALNTFKRVRQRAFNQEDWATKVDAYIAQISASKETFFNAIVDERAWEFGGEMIRKYELIRWNLYSQKTLETVLKNKQYADEASAGTGTGPDYMYWKVDDAGNFVVFNPDNKVLAAPDDTWTRQSFLITLRNDLTQYQEWIINDYNNYYNGPKPGVARYIFPIPINAIDSSQGNLANDNYQFTN